PFLLTDLRPALLHPEVPRMSHDVKREKMEDAVDVFIGEDGEEIIHSSPESGRSGSGSMGSGSMGGRGSMGGPRGGGFGSGGPGKSGSPSKSGGQMGPGGGRGQSFGGSGGMGSSGTVNLETYRPVSKKLVRFVDFEAQPGHKYRYRVTLVLEDPNRPLDPARE